MKLPPHFDLGGFRINMAAASVKISMSHHRQQPGAPNCQLLHSRVFSFRCFGYGFGNASVTLQFQHISFNLPQCLHCANQMSGCKATHMRICFEAS
jgi:hypothetical protein